MNKDDIKTFMNYTPVKSLDEVRTSTVQEFRQDIHNLYSQYRQDTIMWGSVVNFGFIGFFGAVMALGIWALSDGVSQGWWLVLGGGIVLALAIVAFSTRLKRAAKKREEILAFSDDFERKAKESNLPEAPENWQNGTLQPLSAGK